MTQSLSLCQTRGYGRLENRRGFAEAEYMRSVTPEMPEAVFSETLPGGFIF